MALILLPSALATNIIVYDGVNETEANAIVSKFEIPETIHTIIFYDQPNKNCAYYVFGGKIYINMKGECREGVLWFLEHELTHDIFYHKSGQERYDYCKDKEKKGIFCWHNFTDEYMNNKTVEVFNETETATLMPPIAEERPREIRSQILIGHTLMILIVLIGLIIYYAVTTKKEGD